MRRMFAILVACVVVSSTSGVLAQTDPCGGVSCSGHGRCIVVRGEPACACEGGFNPDATALNCMSTAVQVPAEAAAVPEPVVTPVPASAPTPASTATPAPAPVRRDRMLRIPLNALFLSERERPYRDLRVSFWCMWAPGAPLIILAAVNELFGFLEDPVSDTMLGIGAVLVFTACILEIVGFFGQRRIRRAVLAEQRASASVLGMENRF